MQSEWKAACIEATIRNEPMRTLVGETLKKRLFRGMVLDAFSQSVTSSPFGMLATRAIPTAANNYGGNNFIAYSNPDMDAAITEIDTELDPEKRKAAWAIAQKLYADQLPVIPLFFSSEAHVVPNWLKGYEPTGQNNGAFMWSENWHAE
jgi:peptide/nickel transport system substrate-binding protein